MTVNSVPKCIFYSSNSCFIFCRKIFNIFYNFSILAKSVFSFTILVEITLSSPSVREMNSDFQILLIIVYLCLSVYSGVVISRPLSGCGLLRSGYKMGKNKNGFPFGWRQVLLVLHLLLVLQGLHLTVVIRLGRTT